MEHGIEQDTSRERVAKDSGKIAPTSHPVLFGSIVVFAILFICCLLLSQIPLKLAQGVINLSLSPSHFLPLLTSWNTMAPHYAQDPQWGGHMLEFLALICLACILYLSVAYLLTRLPAVGNYRSIHLLIWSVTLLCGLSFIFAPSMLSHDIFSYANYGRLQALYHANPYLTPPSHFPQDTFTRYNDWREVLSTYGPFWQTVCNLFSFPIGNQPGYAILTYRSLGLITHLLNILLIGGILRALGRSPRTITLGMLLYAWNPLVLEEACLGGHNDGFMLLFILLGFFFDIWLASRQSRFLASLPALAAFTLAMLVKFSAAPVLVLYLVLLARRAYNSVGLGQRMKRAALTVIPAGAFYVLMTLAWYLPYWIGMTPTQILQSFTTLPSTRLFYGSILASLKSWQHSYIASPGGSWQADLLSILTVQSIWSIITFITLVCLLVLGSIWLWRSPSLPTLAAASVATLSALLVVTTWFFPWYLIWTVGLIALTLPTAQRITRTLLAFTLTFSISALCTYIYANKNSSIGGWSGVSISTTLLPPLLILTFFLLLPLNFRKTPG